MIDNPRINNNPIKSWFLITLFLIGIAHWLCFFFVTDYYSYNHKNPTSVQHDSSFYFSNNKPLKNDRELIKEVIKTHNVKDLFQYRRFDNADWVKELKYQDVLRSAFKNHEMPYFTPELPTFVNASAMFLAFPAYTLSPQIFLLKFLNSQVFSIVNIILMFSLGFVGSLLFCKKFNLGYLAFSLMFLIFNFNGYWVEKYSAYGPGRLGYYLMPFFLYALFSVRDIQLNDYKQQIRYGLCAGMALAFMLIQGELHLYVECITFMVFWAIVNYQFWRFSLLTFLSAFSIASFRLLPGAISYGATSNSHNVVGYSNISQLFDAFVHLVKPLDFPYFGNHELSLYISLPAFFLLFYMGIWACFFSEKWAVTRYWNMLAIPCLLTLLISIRNFRLILIPNFIPLLNAESHCWRFMIIPLLIVTIIACINLERFIQYHQADKRVKYVLISIVSVIALLLFNHSRVYRMFSRQNAWDWYFPQAFPNNGKADLLLRNTDLVINNAGFHNSLYVISFWLSLFVSVVSFMIICFLVKKYSSSNELK